MRLDRQDAAPREGRLIATHASFRRALFALLPLLALVGGATVVLRTLERRAKIDTERPDDRVAYLAHHAMTLREDHGQPVWVIDDWSMAQSRFPQAKPPKTMRIFLTGESFAMGSPYVGPKRATHGYGDIAHWLSAELEWRYPGFRFEVVNAAAGGQNSNRIRQIVEDLLPARPDLLIAAVGNNEGWVAPSPFNEALHKWVVYRALKKALLPAASPGERPYFTPQDRNPAAIERQFQANLKRMVELCRAQSVALALATLPINVKYPLGASRSVTPAGIEADEFITRGRELMRERQYAAAIDVFSQSAQRAFAARLIAECYEEMGDFDRAREQYRAYVQSLPLNRTRPSYNDFLRSLAEAESLPLVDLERAVEEASPHGIADPGLFLDYCHMTWRGYQLVAAEIARALIDQERIPPEFGQPGLPPTVEQMIARHGWQALYEADPAAASVRAKR
jgi:lysophospholipase L1-like esterase